MSMLHEQAVQMINDLSEENVSFLIEIIQRLMPQQSYEKVINATDNEGGIQAFNRLNAARKEFKHYFPKDFDPEKELEEARAERYGSVD